MFDHQWNKQYIRSDKSRAIDEYILECNNGLQFVDIGVLRADSANDRSVIFYPKNGRSEVIPVWSAKREPYSYPMLFCNGELGWGNENKMIKKDKLNFVEYLSSLMIRVKPDNIRLPSKMYPNTRDADIYVNRFQAMPRTGQTFVVDAISTMVDTELKYPKNHPEMITGGDDKYGKWRKNGKCILLLLVMIFGMI